MVPRCLSSLHMHPLDSSRPTVDYNKSIKGVKHLDQAIVISNGSEDKLAQVQRAFPGTPVTPLTTPVSTVRPSLKNKPFHGVKNEGRKGGCSFFF